MSDVDPGATSAPSKVGSEAPSNKVGKNPAPPAPKEYLLLFQQNRRMELPIGGTTYVFDPYGSQRVPEAVRFHPDCLAAMAQGFIAVQEV